MNQENDSQLIFKAAVERVNSKKLLKHVLNLDGNILKVKTDNDEIFINLF